MKNDDLLKDFHIGKWIKEVAFQKHISSKEIVKVFDPPRYGGNEDKIFKLKDLDVEVALRISNLLGFNLLRMISDRYLVHLPFSGNNIKDAYDTITLDLQTSRFMIQRKRKKDFWEQIHIGQYLKDAVQKKGWSEHYLLTSTMRHPKKFSKNFGQITFQWIYVF